MTLAVYFSNEKLVYFKRQSRHTLGMTHARLPRLSSPTLLRFPFGILFF